MSILKTSSLLLAAALLAGCASAPLAPRVAVMPAPNKPFDVFAAEDRLCRLYAEQSVGVGTDDPAARRAVEAGIIGTAVGALAGAALGGRDGAAVGAGVGLFAGAAAGHGEHHYISRDLQRRYDIAYQQCMYAKGNQVPGSYYRPADGSNRPAAYPPPPPPPPAAGTKPPPASGAMPPPPPGR